MRSLIMVFGLVLMVFTGCSQRIASSPGSDTAFAVPSVRASVTFKMIYSFKSAPDGAMPEAGLTLFAGKFYGTTHSGGTGPHSDGTVFTVREDGDEHIIHNFRFAPDGSKPEGGLTNFNNLAFYGTTSVGGNKTFGIVYEIKPDGTERVVYNFRDDPDGANPIGNLTVLNGQLYGTTLAGGPAGVGVVFEVHADGKERVVYAFSGKPDGAYPHGGMAQLDGALYGTTEEGGTNNLGCVFKVKPDGTEKVLYSFRGAGSGDGSSPLAGLAAFNGLLYGVTKKGGANDVGTVFEVRDDGKERVIHSFNGSDGRFPYAGLTVLKDLLYGTTIGGGANGFGTVFEIRMDGAFRMLHDFTGPEGAKPEASLTVAGGNALIGTTGRGGEKNNGTVFLVRL